MAQLATMFTGGGLLSNLSSIASTTSSVGGPLLSFGLKEAQSKMEHGQAEIAARDEELRLIQREADRKDRLASALSAQNAMSGARGVAAFEGSPLAVLQDSISRADVASERDEFSTKMATLAIRSSAKSKRIIDKLSNRLGLIQSGTGMLKSLSGPIGGAGG
ncbi:MAG: hypothetical protein OEX12_01085 [Gammaproteobacteria bacterium]|nr:hypothetical protein [Gammaproteobacteria bacterium]